MGKGERGVPRPHTGVLERKYPYITSIAKAFNMLLLFYGY